MTQTDNLNNLKILGLDTTSKHASIAIAQDNQIILEFNFTTLDNLSATLIPSIDSALKSAGLTLDQIDVFGICTGPGRFTGIRVGLSTLKGLLLANQKPVAAIDTLKTLANKYYFANTPIIALIDAKREEVYAAAYDVSNPGEPQEMIPPTLTGIHHLKEYLIKFDPNIQNKDLQWVGSGADAYENLIKENFPNSVICRRSHFLAPEVCQQALAMHNKNKTTTNMQNIAPFYIRKPDAEQNLERQKAKEKR